MAASTSNTVDQTAVIYQGQFGEFTINDGDRQEVVIYRSGLGLAALCLGIGVSLLLWQGATPAILHSLTACYALFCLGLGVSLWTIHIYMVPLHRTLQIFWGIGTVCSLYVGVAHPEPFMQTVYQTPQVVLGIGFLFAALTGIFFKEAFCFNRLETKGLTLLTPMILLGHLTGLIPPHVNLVLMALAALLMGIFALRKAFQAIPQDIGDKSVFEYLKQRQAAT